MREILLRLTLHDVISLLPPHCFKTSFVSFICPDAVNYVNRHWDKGLSFVASCFPIADNIRRRRIMVRLKRVTASRRSTILTTV